jgi:hypothetical protein
LPPGLGLIADLPRSVTDILLNNRFMAVSIFLASYSALVALNTCCCSSRVKPAFLNKRTA